MIIVNKHTDQSVIAIIVVGVASRQSPPPLSDRYVLFSVEWREERARFQVIRRYIYSVLHVQPE